MKELQHKEAQLKLQEEKIAAIQEKLELAEQKLAQYSKLPEMEEQLKQRMEALTQVRSQVRSSTLTSDVHICTNLYRTQLFSSTNLSLSLFAQLYDLIMLFNCRFSLRKMKLDSLLGKDGCF